MKIVNCLISTIASCSLLACGGGGGDNPQAGPSPATVTVAFPLKSALSALAISGYSRSFSVSGTCTGTAIFARSPASPGAIFQGVAALSAVGTVTTNVTNCSPASSVARNTVYFDSNGVQLGFSSGNRFGVFTAPPSVPDSVAVGSTGLIGTESLYTDSTKTMPTGRSELSYFVEPDTDATAIVNLIEKVYDPSNALLFTEQQRARITPGGTLTLVSIDSQFSTTATSHFIYQ